VKFLPEDRDTIFGLREWALKEPCAAGYETQSGPREAKGKKSLQYRRGRFVRSRDYSPKGLALRQRKKTWEKMTDFSV